MKRSVIIKQLKYWLFGNTNNPNHELEAEALLNKIEDMGMLPSSIRYNATGDYVNINDTDILHDNDISFAFESEDKV